LRVERICPEGRWSLDRPVPGNEDFFYDRAYVVPLSQEECLALLSTVSIGRIGTTVDALPVVLPVTFALHNGSIVFRTMPRTKLHDATRNAVIACRPTTTRVCTIRSAGPCSSKA
jgi:hypothetical protein